MLGLKFQPRPPYNVLATPTLERGDFYQLMDEAQTAFGAEYDALPPPRLGSRRSASGELPAEILLWNLDEPAEADWPAPSRRAQAFSLWMRSVDFARVAERAVAAIERALEDNPFTTLQVVLETPGDPRHLTPVLLERFARACFARPTYLDQFYAVQPGRPRGAKRLVAAAPLAARHVAGEAWIDGAGELADIVWRASPADRGDWPDDLAPWEYVEAAGIVRDGSPAEAGDSWQKDRAGVETAIPFPGSD
jgi:hypothetical protein